MTRTTWTPEEFERLLALPAGAPERVAAEASLAFQARTRMLQSFEGPGGHELGPGELASARDELSERLERALQLPIPRPGTTASAPRAGAAPARGPLLRLPAWLDLPHLRPALAFASVLVVVAVGWWFVGRGPAPREVRGTSSESAALTLAPPRVRPGAVELAWNAVPGAESYRLVFQDERFAELARIDGLRATRFVLGRDELPAGLAPGAEVALEVQALQNGDVLARSQVRSLRVP